MSPENGLETHNADTNQIAVWMESIDNSKWLFEWCNLQAALKMDFSFSLQVVQQDRKNKKHAIQLLKGAIVIGCS